MASMLVARRATAVLLSATCAGAMLAATPVAAQLRGTAPAAPATECGGLQPDGRFSAEVTGLGRSHACEHLQARQATGISHPTDLTRLGERARAALPSRAPADVGSWSSAVNPGTKTIGISAVLFHTGEVMLFGGKYERTDRNTASYLYDPVTRTGHEVPAPAAVYCGGVTILADGRMFSSGGAFPKVPFGIPEQWLFNAVKEKWIRQPDTERSRYYPTTTKLANGSVVVTAGTEADGLTKNPQTEVYTPAGGGTPAQVRTVGTNHATQFYPRQWTMPDGNMLQMDYRAVFELDSTSWDWTALPQMLTATGLGAAGLMHAGGPLGSNKVSMIGGLKNGQANALVQHFNYANPAAGWSYGTPMPTARSHMNVVQVPDGSAFAIGGNSVGSYDVGRTQTLHYDPKADKWTNMAVQSVRRAYHSTALLLPDGRIMSAGDTGDGGGRSAIDFYSPPYMFQTRPSISRVPEQIGYGSNFAVRTNGPRTSRAVLMAPSATTHANEMHARHVELAVTETSRGLHAAAPPNSRVAPPGYYMLFTLTPGGVPSKARWVHLG